MFNILLIPRIFFTNYHHVFLYFTGYIKIDKVYIISIICLQKSKVLLKAHIHYDDKSMLHCGEYVDLCSSGEPERVRFLVEYSQQQTSFYRWSHEDQ